MTPLNLMTMIGKSFAYPLKNITGSPFCHAESFLVFWSLNYAHLLSFCVTVFRYCCLYYKEKLLKWKLNPQVSALIKLSKLHSTVVSLLLNQGQKVFMCLLFENFSVDKEVVKLKAMKISFWEFFSITLQFTQKYLLCGYTSQVC